MKFLKGCATSVLCLLISVFSLTAFLMLGLQATVLNANVMSKLIDKIDLKEIAPVITQQILSDNLEKEEQLPIEIETINEVIDNVKEKDIDLVRETAREIVVKFYNFINGKTKSFEMEIDLTKFIPMVANVLVSSPEMMEQMNLPFEICENNQNDECITKEKFTNILSKAFTKTLTAEDVIEILPKCPNNSAQISGEDMPECIPTGNIDNFEQELDKYLEENGLNTTGNNINNDQDESFPETIIISSKNLPQEVYMFKNILNSYIKLAPYVLLAISIVLILFVFLIQNVNGFIWIGTLSILQGLLLISGKFTSGYSEEFAISQIESQVPSIDPKLINIITEILLHFVNYFNDLIAKYGLVMIGIGILMICAWILLRKSVQKEVTVKDAGIDKIPEHLPKAAHLQSVL